MKLKRWKITIFDSGDMEKGEDENNKKKKKTLTPNSKSVQNSSVCVTRAKKEKKFSLPFYRLPYR